MWLMVTVTFPSFRKMTHVTENMTSRWVVHESSSGSSGFSIALDVVLYRHQYRQLKILRRIKAKRKLHGDIMLPQVLIDRS